MTTVATPLPDASVCGLLPGKFGSGSGVIRTGPTPELTAVDIVAGLEESTALLSGWVVVICGNGGMLKPFGGAFDDA